MNRSWPGGSENHLVRYVARENHPGTQIHQDAEFEEVQHRQTGTEEHAHPDHALIVHQVKYVLGDLEVAVLRKLLLQIPAPAVVHVTHENGAEEIHAEGG